MPPSPARKPRVIMFVRNNCNNDARVLKEARTLVENGYDVRILGLLVDTQVEEEVRDGIRITRVPPTPMERKLPHAAETFLQSALKLALATVDRAMRRGGPGAKISLGRDRIVEGVRAVFAYYWRSVEIALEDPADVYHGHDLSAVLPAYLAARLKGGKVVYDSHELFTERNTSYDEGFVVKTALRMLERYLIRRVDRVITVNRSIAEELQKRYGLAQTPAIVMNCPPLSITAPTNLLRDKLGLAADTPVALYIGAISFNRGIEQTIEAMARLEGVVFVAMGPARAGYVDQLRALAAERGVADRVFFLPPVPHTEVPMHASSASLSVAPIQNACLSYYFCTPNKLFESIMAGLPVAASDFPEMRAIIDREDIGTVFDPADPGSIAAAIRSLLSDPARYKQMRENAYAAAPKYSWETERERLLAVYAGLAPAGPGASSPTSTV